MNYLHLINNFWQIAGGSKFSNFEIALYFYLLQQCNRSRWQLSIVINSSEILAFFQVHRHTLAAALENLDNFTQLKIEKKQGSKFLKVGIENGQVFKNKVGIENRQVFNSEKKVVQKVVIENGQVLENFENLHYNNNYINNKNNKYNNKNNYIDNKKNLENLGKILQENLNNFTN